MDRFWLFAPRDQGKFHHRLELQVGGQTVGEVVYGLSMADARDALSRAMGWCALVGLFSVVTLFGLQWLLGAADAPAAPAGAALPGDCRWPV